MNRHWPPATLSPRNRALRIPIVMFVVLLAALAWTPAAPGQQRAAAGNPTGTGTQSRGMGIGNAGEVTPYRPLRGQRYVPGDGDRRTLPGGIHRQSGIGIDDGAVDRSTTPGGIDRMGIFDTDRGGVGRGDLARRDRTSAGRGVVRSTPDRIVQGRPATVGVPGETRGELAPLRGRIIERTSDDFQDELPAVSGVDFPVSRADEFPLELRREAIATRDDEIPARLRPTPLTDEAFESAILRQLRSDPFIDSEDAEEIGVSVENGRATIAGRVSSTAARRRALDAALMPGVVAVDASQLRIAPPPGVVEFRESELVPDSDAEITRAILRAYYVHREVDPRRIQVRVNDGIVELNGVVDVAYEKNAAIEIARDIPGVRQVVDRLRIGPIEELLDLELADGIRDAIERDPFIERYEVGVTVSDRIARLEGSVSSYADLQRAVQLAESVNGIWGVDNQLIVDPNDSPIFAYETLERLRLLSQAPYYEDELALLPPSDEEIEAALANEIQLNPVFNPETINYAVHEGTAVLTGSVNSWTARRLATMAAFAAGARFVENRLSVIAAGEAASVIQP